MTRRNAAVLPSAAASHGKREDPLRNNAIGRARQRKNYEEKRGRQNGCKNRI
jgi:hypothetical protein